MYNSTDHRRLTVPIQDTAVSMYNILRSLFRINLAMLAKFAIDYEGDLKNLIDDNSYEHFFKFFSLLPVVLSTRRFFLSAVLCFICHSAMKYKRIYLPGVVFHLIFHSVFLFQVYLCSYSLASLLIC